MQLALALAIILCCPAVSSAFLVSNLPGFAPSQASLQDGNRVRLISSNVKTQTPSSPSNQIRSSRLFAKTSSSVLHSLRCQATSSKRVVIVGGGVGGLAVAGRLACSRPDWQIEVLEKNGAVGGRVDEHVSGSGYRFDTGPSLLLAPDIYKDTFTALGSRLEDFTNLLRVEPAYRVFLGDNSNVTVTADLNRMKEQLENIEPGSFRQYLAYMQEACTNYVEGFNSKPFSSKDNSLLDYVNLENLALLRKFDVANLVQTHEQRLKQYFSDPRLWELFSFQDLYVGLSPHTAPAIFSLLQYLEIIEGIWYPEGGFQKVISGMREAIGRRATVSVRTGACVDRILEADSGTGRRVTGVRLEGGEVIEADLVVSNVDLPTTYNSILSVDSDADRAAAKRLAELDYSSGVIAFYWPVKRIIPELQHHTIFMSPGGKASWDILFRGDASLPEQPSFYVACPSKTDASAAPAGCESMMVLVPCGCMPADGQGDYDALIQQARKAVLDRLKSIGADIEADVVWAEERVIAPPEWRSRYGLFRGAAFGLAHPLSQLVMFRPANRHKDLHNLFFVGASTAPGNGVPLVLTGARMCTERILDQYA